MGVEMKLTRSYKVSEVVRSLDFCPSPAKLRTCVPGTALSARERGICYSEMASFLFMSESNPLRCISMGLYPFFPGVIHLLGMLQGQERGSSVYHCRIKTQRLFGSQLDERVLIIDAHMAGFLLKQQQQQAKQNPQFWAES